ncbi:MAG: hypothetical protein P9L98_05395 [Candidatus Kaelpia imicola]|nr:hypothetical protein [Candidatus Kaelpia imicola]
MKRIIIGIIVIVIFIAVICSLRQKISLTNEQAEWIGKKIFYNECGGKIEFLVTWNEGEDFMSIGIGHFIWYPKGKKGPFEESFPKLLLFVKEKGKTLPNWLQESGEPHCPWRSRDEFLQDLQNQKVADLREFLMETKSLQLLFLVERLKEALPKMLKAAPEKLQPHIERQFYRLALTPAGMYALIDYVNFKGEGTLSTERYKGQGWGLLQVLEEMKGNKRGTQVLQEFVQVAEKLLTERVKNAPPRRNEQKWLPGWKRRLNTYIDVLADFNK